MRIRCFILDSKLEQSFCADSVGFFFHNVLLGFLTEIIVNKMNCMVMYYENVRVNFSCVLIFSDSGLNLCSSGRSYTFGTGVRQRFFIFHNLLLFVSIVLLLAR